MFDLYKQPPHRSLEGIQWGQCIKIHSSVVFVLQARGAPRLLSHQPSAGPGPRSASKGLRPAYLQSLSPWVLQAWDLVTLGGRSIRLDKGHGFSVCPTINQLLLTNHPSLWLRAHWPSGFPEPHDLLPAQGPSVPSVWKRVPHFLIREAFPGGPDSIRSLLRLDIPSGW